MYVKNLFKTSNQSRISVRGCVMEGYSCQNVDLLFDSRIFSGFSTSDKMMELAAWMYRKCDHLLGPYTHWLTIVYSYRHTNIYIYPESILYKL